MRSGQGGIGGLQGENLGWAGHSIHKGTALGSVDSELRSECGGCFPPGWIIPGCGWWDLALFSEAGLRCQAVPLSLCSLPVCHCRERAQGLPCHSRESAEGTSGSPPRVSCCPSEQPGVEGREEG